MLLWCSEWPGKVRNGSGLAMNALSCSFRYAYGSDVDLEGEENNNGERGGGGEGECTLSKVPEQSAIINVQTHCTLCT